MNAFAKQILGSRGNFRGEGHRSLRERERERVGNWKNGRMGREERREEIVGCLVLKMCSSSCLIFGILVSVI